ncbi:MAG: hypothetical protein ACKVZ0_10065 [Gemmatimonadales bacterium]
MSTSDTRWGYFMLQARSDSPDREGGVVVRGVVENLVTGEKQRFESAAEIAALLSRWVRSAGPVK